MSPRRRRRLFATSLVVVLLLGGGGYVTAAALADLPEPTLALEVEPVREASLDEAPLTALVDGESRPTAVGWGEKETPVWSNDDSP